MENEGLGAPGKPPGIEGEEEIVEGVSWFLSRETLTLFLWLSSIRSSSLIFIR